MSLQNCSAGDSASVDLEEEWMTGLLRQMKPVQRTGTGSQMKVS